MSKLNSVLILIGLVLVSCKGDDDPTPDVNFVQERLSDLGPRNEIFYDSGPNDAPQLPRGLSYQAARFAAADLQKSNHVGRAILGVDFYIQDVPDAIKVIVHRWHPNASNEPGAVLYQHTLTASDLSSSSWINHDLTEDLDVPAEGFWIILEVDAGNRDLRVTGCDDGPRHPNGDVMGLFGPNLPGWTSFFSYSGDQVSINWNIRTILHQ